MTGGDLGEGVEVQEEGCGGLLHVFGPLLSVDLLSFLVLLGSVSISIRIRLLALASDYWY